MGRDRGGAGDEVDLLFSCSSAIEGLSLDYFGRGGECGNYRKEKIDPELKSL
ncbi:hypothetical protein [Sinobacterium caligoides]|uniref:hypothetical protein n=1 Tax=Sinobacterium caligoides TaxID=933926 RepID=UPI0013C31E30|nr:hypothetical protein [Sinobacterium caligoides]